SVAEERTARSARHRSGNHCTGPDLHGDMRHAPYRRAGPHAFATKPERSVAPALDQRVVPLGGGGVREFRRGCDPERDAIGWHFRPLDVKHAGGVTIVQSPDDAEWRSMPESALQNVPVDHCIPASEIGPLLVELAGRHTGWAGNGKRPRILIVEDDA